MAAVAVPAARCWNQPADAATRRRALGHETAAGVGAVEAAVVVVVVVAAAAVPAPVAGVADVPAAPVAVAAVAAPVAGATRVPPGAAR